MEAVPSVLPLPTLLSQVLVAHTIELDNEAEHQLPHRTTRRRDLEGRREDLWLVSYTLSANVLRHVDGFAITVADLCQRARTTRLLLGGLRRWGYVTVTAPAGQTLKNPPQETAVVRITQSGRRAQKIWRPLPAAIEQRWRARFGHAALDELERTLRAVFGHLPVRPPAYLPVVYPTQNGKAETPPPRTSHTADARGADLSELLSGVLLAFTLDFETQSRISLPISATTLRVLDQRGVRHRDLPRLTGVSKEANAMCGGWLVRHGCAVSEPDPTATRGKVLRLTPKGHKAQQKYHRILGSVEETWRSSYGASAVDALRAALAAIAGDGTLGSSPLAAGLVPYPDNWRACFRQRPDTLPHYPMVLHRGGFPDGS